MASWDTSFDTDWTYSNNDQTAEHPGGNSLHQLKMTPGADMLLVNGAAYYVEINIDSVGTAFAFSIQALTDESGDEERVSITQRDDTWVAVLSAAPNITMNTPNAIGKGYAPRRLLDVISGANWSADDRIGILWEFGTNRSPIVNQVHFSVNGVNIGSISHNRILDFFARTYFLSLDIQASDSGTGATVTIHDDPADWLHTPLIPWAQKWEATPSAVPAADLDTGYCRWNADRDSSLVDPNNGCTILSNNMLTFDTENDSSFNQQSHAGASTARVEGKYYFEMTLVDATNRTIGPEIGIENCGQDVAGGGSDVNRFVYRMGSTEDTWYTPGSNIVAGGGNILTVSDGDVIMFAFDLNREIDAVEGQVTTKGWIGKNGSWDSGDPGMGTSPVEARINDSCAAWTPCIMNPSGNHGQAGIFKTNFGATAFAHTIPTGYVGWDTTALPAGAS